MNPIELAQGEVVDPEVIGPATSLEEFMARDDIEESPCWEYIDGRMVRKAMPKWKHNALAAYLIQALKHHVDPPGLGEVLAEQRCNFAGRSIVPDAVFMLEASIEFDDQGDPLEVIPRPPDLMVEVLSPGQSVKSADSKLRHALAHGCPLGWFAHPYRETITVYRPGAEPVELGLDGVLEGEPVLPGFRLPVAEVFGWLNRRRKGGTQ